MDNKERDKQLKLLLDLTIAMAVYLYEQGHQTGCGAGSDDRLPCLCGFNNYRKSFELSDKDKP